MENGQYWMCGGDNLKLETVKDLATNSFDGGSNVVCEICDDRVHIQSFDYHELEKPYVYEQESGRVLCLECVMGACSLVD